VGQALSPANPLIYFGFLLSGAGKAWADDLRLLVDGKTIAEALKVERLKTLLDTDHESTAAPRSRSLI